MSCGCENRKMSGEIERIRRLAKSLAVMEGKDVVIVRKTDGTYDFHTEDTESDRPIVEYVSQY